MSGEGTNDDSFYTTFTIVEPVSEYQDPGEEVESHLLIGTEQLMLVTPRQRVTNAAQADGRRS